MAKILNHSTMLPGKLKDVFIKYSEDDISINIKNAGFSGDKFNITFIVTVKNIYQDIYISQTWTIDVAGHRKSHVSFDMADFPEIKDDDPLLWEFTDTQCQLYFTGQCKDPVKLFYDLYTTHRGLFGMYQCFDIDLYNTPGFKPFTYTNGMLSQGSKKLLEKYADCLQQNGLDFSIIGERPATYWNGEQYVLEETNLKVLLFGDTYVVAKEFSFVLQEETSK